MTLPYPKKRSLGIILLLVLFCLGPRPVSGDEMTVDVGAMIYETQKSSRGFDKVIMAWWIPNELWTLFLVKDTGISEADRKNFLKTLEPYTIMMVMDGFIPMSGTAEFMEEPEIRKHLQLIYSQGKTYKPIKEKSISKEAKNSLKKVGPFFDKVLGPVSENAHFFLFPAKSANKDMIANAFAEGTFVLKMKKNSFRWRTPLWPLVPSKHCPVTGEELQGGWKYNPWNGAKLD